MSILRRSRKPQSHSLRVGVPSPREMEDSKADGWGKPRNTRKVATNRLAAFRSQPSPRCTVRPPGRFAFQGHYTGITDREDIAGIYLQIEFR